MEAVPEYQTQRDCKWRLPRLRRLVGVLDWPWRFEEFSVGFLRIPSFFSHIFLVSSPASAFPHSVLSSASRGLIVYEVFDYVHLSSILPESDNIDDLPLIIPFPHARLICSSFLFSRAGTINDPHVATHQSERS